MELMCERCAGLDVHKGTVVACVRLQVGGRVSHEVRTFSTMTRELLDLEEWLCTSGCTQVVMESTGVYWKPVWNILSNSPLKLVLANAKHVRNVPGRKSDVKDAVWLADLLAHGLIAGSFVPPAKTQELRDLMRTRRQLIRQRVRHVQRLQKTLEDANIKLDSVITDILGMSGRQMVTAIIEGESDPEVLVGFANYRLKASRETLVDALRGRPTPHHRLMLRLHLDQIDTTQKSIDTIDEEVERLTEPFRLAVRLLATIPGISDEVAWAILAEIGTDMAQFRTAAALISWAGLCPKLDETAGKRRSTRIRKGAPWLKPILVQAAWSAIRMKGSYLGAQYGRLKAKRGPKKAIVAVAASMLTAAYHMLRDGTVYHDLGAEHFKREDRGRTAKRLVKRLKDLGFQVEVRDAA